MSNFNGGFRNGVSIRGVPLAVTHPGKVFWVSNNSTLDQGENSGSNGNDGSFKSPYATIHYASTQCRANKGDVIFVKPGHVETVSAAAGLALAVAGVAIVGLGKGAARPKINLTATASTITFTAASVMMSNIVITGGIDAVVSAIVISAADVQLIDIEMRDVTGQMTAGVLTTAGANRLLIDGFVYDGDVAAGGAAAIAIVGGDKIRIRNLDIIGNFSVGCIDIRTTATTNILVTEVVRARNYNASCIFLIDTITASTGQIGPNINIHLLTDAANITEAITGATLVVMGQVLVVNKVGEQGFAINWTASSDAIV